MMEVSGSGYLTNGSGTQEVKKIKDPSDPDLEHWA